MNHLSWLAHALSHRKIRRATSRHIEQLRSTSTRVSRGAVDRLLADFNQQPGVKVHVGDTAWGDCVSVPLSELVRSCGVMTGGMGSGKTMAACTVAKAIIEQLPELDSVGFGVLDPKGELYDTVLYLVAERLQKLDGNARQALLDRVVVIDFSAREALCSYNILAHEPYSETDFFINSRLETLCELLPSGDKLSLRGAHVLKNAIALLSDCSLPIVYLDELLSSPLFRHKIVKRSHNAIARSFFEHYFDKESQATVAALRVRMDTLFASEGVRLALSGSTAPDFRALQNEGKVVLINCAGPSITRGVRLLLQGLILSDIRQAIFARPNRPRVNYLWLMDEAQNFFINRQQAADVLDTLTMGRSFGTFFMFLCQNLTASVPDSRLLEQLYTNIRWSLTLRGTPSDARFLRAALPATGNRLKPQAQAYQERVAYSPDEERTLLLEEIANLPDRTGYLWLKALSREAVKITTADVALPSHSEFRRAVNALREEPGLGRRISRSEHEEQTDARQNEWFGNKTEEASTTDEVLGEKYEQEASAWRPSEARG